MSYLVAIIGPTATGKTSLAVSLACQFNGEIVNADSRQVYRHMDIGTAKPSREELSIVSHHLIDIIDPDEDFSLARYQQMAYRAINDIQGRGKLPFLVGGSGLYVRAVLEGWQIPPVPPDAEFRRSLEERASRGEDLYRELVLIDAAAAEKIDPRNLRRIIRALEASRHAGTAFSRLQGKKPPLFKTLIIGLMADRQELYRRIDTRVDWMIEHGFIEEVKNLMETGYNLELPSMSGIGYKQIGLYLKGELSLELAVQQIKFETHRIARHQYGWFRLSDERINWFDIQQDIEPEIRALIVEFLSA